MTGKFDPEKVCELQQEIDKALGQKFPELAEGGILDQLKCGDIMIVTRQDHQEMAIELEKYKTQSRHLQEKLNVMQRNAKFRCSSVGPAIRNRHVHLDKDCSE